MPVKLGGNPLRLHCMPVKGFRCRSNSTGQIGWKSIEITLYVCQSNWVEIHWDYIVCMPVELGGNPLRLHCMYAGRIGWKSIEITLYVCQLNWVEIHWDYIVCMPVEFDRSNWVEIHWDYIVCLLKALDAGGIRWKSIEITLYVCQLNWVEIHWDYIVCLLKALDAGRIGWSNWIEIQWDDDSNALTLVKFNQFDRASSQWISTQFIRFNQASSQWKIDTKLHSTSEVDSTSKSTGFIKLLHFWVFQHFLSSKSTFMTCPQTGRLQF